MKLNIYLNFSTGLDLIKLRVHHLRYTNIIIEKLHSV